MCIRDRAYTLEVTSPGVDRPLTQPRHWRRATGRLVRAARTDGGTVTGRVLDVTDDTVVLDVDGRPRELALDTVARATVEVEFRRLEADDAPDDGEPGEADA
jgi:ribosome maturation factor RimP